MQHIGILLAGGKGSRMKRPGDDKLLREIHNSTPFRLCYESFLGSKIVDNVIIVYRDNDQLEKINQEIEVAHKKSKKSFSPIFAKGGMERYESVLTGLSVCYSECEFVYVHDCARPLIRSGTIDELGNIAKVSGAAITARPINDTIKKIFPNPTSQNQNTYRSETIDRSFIWIMETPQVCRKDWLLRGMKKIEAEKILVTDEASILELINKEVSLHDPGYPNPKITTNSDWPYIEFLLSQR
tara:strand:- start:437 stop:1159 length:723 start_codon:yes stop_codon:yes gene_type:complete